MGHANVKMPRFAEAHNARVSLSQLQKLGFRANALMAPAGMRHDLVGLLQIECAARILQANLPFLPTHCLNQFRRSSVPLRKSSFKQSMNEVLHGPLLCHLP